MPSKRGQDRSHLLGGNVSGQSSLVEFDQAMYGEIEQVDAGRQIAEPISIFEIYPDPTQPRRALPSEVQQSWNGLPDTVPGMLDRWICWKMPDDVYDSRVAFIRDMVIGQSKRDFEVATKTNSVEAAYLKIVEVAAGIYRDGLINPITVVRTRLGYRLETGERRWLAYHLLQRLFDDEQWTRIPARLVEVSNVWRQAAENSARDNLNAIARARQVAILIMDLLGVENFQHFEVFENEREYYAQVADGEVYRIPKGQTEKLLQAIGLKSSEQVRQYRRLLRLSDSIWKVADDENWTEGKLRKYIPNDEDTVTTVTVSAPTLPTLAPGTREHFAALAKATRKAGQGDQKALQQMRDLARDILRLADEWEQRHNE